MNTLRIYGVNYAASPEFSWTKMLAAKLDMNLYNKALDGSSTEYAIKQLLSDVRSGKIIPGDVVVYVPMHMGRLHFTHQNSVAPKTAALYIHSSRNIDKSHTWYWDNQHHIEWWMNNVDRELLDINFEAYVQLVRTLAQGMPDNPFIVLPAYKSTINIPRTNNILFLIVLICFSKYSLAKTMAMLMQRMRNCEMVACKGQRPYQTNY